MTQADKLLEIASCQGGYFTSSQAEKCGYARSNFHFKIKSGKWSKEMRGIYRLTHFPIHDSAEYILWSLWARDKNGALEGVWSHETALMIHQATDLMPSKMHLSVPKYFRRSKVPRHLVLHKSCIEDEDIEVKDGYFVTTPLRTLNDVILESRLSHEQIIDAAKQMFLKGKVSFKELEMLSRLCHDKSLSKSLLFMLAETYNDALKVLRDNGSEVEPHTVVFGFGKEGRGTGVFIEYESNYYILTATHVARELKKSKSRIFMRFDGKSYDPDFRTPDEYKVLELDPEFKLDILDSKGDALTHAKDLALVQPSAEVVRVLRLFKYPYKFLDFSSIASDDALFAFGFYSSSVGPLSMVLSEIKKSKNCDYLVCSVTNDTYQIRSGQEKPIANFNGLSGSGLWKIQQKSHPVLVGITIAQYLQGPQEGEILFHGIEAILSLLKRLKRYKF